MSIKLDALFFPDELFTKSTDREITEIYKDKYCIDPKSKEFKTKSTHDKNIIYFHCGIVAYFNGRYIESLKNFESIKGDLIYKEAMLYIVNTKLHKQYGPLTDILLSVKDTQFEYLIMLLEYKNKTITLEMVPDLMRALDNVNATILQVEYSLFIYNVIKVAEITDDIPISIEKKILSLSVATQNNIFPLLHDYLFPYNVHKNIILAKYLGTTVRDKILIFEHLITMDAYKHVINLYREYNIKTNESINFILVLNNMKAKYFDSAQIAYLYYFPNIDNIKSEIIKINMIMIAVYLYYLSKQYESVIELYEKYFTSAVNPLNRIICLSYIKLGLNDKANNIFMKNYSIKNAIDLYIATTLETNLDKKEMMLIKYINISNVQLNYNIKLTYPINVDIEINLSHTDKYQIHEFINAAKQCNFHKAIDLIEHCYHSPVYYKYVLITLISCNKDSMEILRTYYKSTEKSFDVVNLNIIIDYLNTYFPSIAKKLLLQQEPQIIQYIQHLQNDLDTVELSSTIELLKHLYIHSMNTQYILYLAALGDFSLIYKANIEDVIQYISKLDINKYQNLIRIPDDYNLEFYIKYRLNVIKLICTEKQRYIFEYIPDKDTLADPDFVKMFIDAKEWTCCNCMNKTFCLCLNFDYICMNCLVPRKT
jgi:hypothetical protein